MNNTKQLSLAWIMFSGDNQEKLVNNYTASLACGKDAWVSKDPVGAAWTGNAQTDSTNLAIINGALYDFNKSTAIYHCPADQSIVTGSTSALRTRSYSMSTGVNWTTDGQAVPAGIPTKTTAMNNPSPVLASVFIDEQEDSIDNNAIGIRQKSKLTTYWNVPAARRHSGSGVISFGDGHSEVWRWKKSYILTAKSLSYGTTTIPADDSDDQRLAETVPDGTYGP